MKHYHAPAVICRRRSSTGRSESPARNASACAPSCPALGAPRLGGTGQAPRYRRYTTRYLRNSAKNTNRRTGSRPPFTRLCGAFRRSELVSLDVPDWTFVSEGVIVRLRRSKTDPGRRWAGDRHSKGGSRSHVPGAGAAPWIDMAATGPLFRAVNRHGQIGQSRLSAKTVALIVKRYARSALTTPTSARALACDRGCDRSSRGRSA